MAVATLLAAGVLMLLLGIFTGTFALIGLGVGALVIAAILETYARSRGARAG